MKRRAFALPDLLAVTLVLAAVAALLLPAASRTRRLSSLGESMTNLRQYGCSLGSYASDNVDRIFSFSWQAGVVNPTTYADLRGPFGDDLSAASAQAVDIMRRRANRADIPLISSWIPHIKFSHLVLADYYAAALPLRWSISPEDERLQAWANDPAAFDRGQLTPQPTPGPGTQRWPYSSTYEIGPAFYSPDYVVGAVGTVTQATTHSTYQILGGTLLGRRRTAEIAYSSQKAFAWDPYQRHLGPRIAYFMYPEARVPICFADGSVAVRATSSANRGFNPSNPQALFPTTLTYQPLSWEPPALGGTNLTGMYRWTRPGLLGRDFDGDEIATPR
ncbi:MAG: hypothetical protein JSR77_12620 [Planctomycetes bacterium]|nr:hypothetical protein [Planctomycetota bacterium]